MARSWLVQSWLAWSAGAVAAGGVAGVPVSVVGVVWANETPAGKHKNAAAATAIRVNFCI
jgi:hypothetical protein